MFDRQHNTEARSAQHFAEVLTIEASSPLPDQPETLVASSRPAALAAIAMHRTFIAPEVWCMLVAERLDQLQDPIGFWRPRDISLISRSVQALRGKPPKLTHVTGTIGIPDHTETVASLLAAQDGAKPDVRFYRYGRKIVDMTRPAGHQPYVCRQPPSYGVMPDYSDFIIAFNKRGWPVGVLPLDEPWLLAVSGRHTNALPPFRGVETGNVPIHRRITDLLTADLSIGTKPKWLV